MMKQMLLSLALVVLALSGPAFGGGWESSGDRAASPVRGQPAKGPFNYLCSLHVSDTNGDRRGSFDMTQALTDTDFKDGRAEFTTDSPSHGYLKGHKVSLHVYENGTGQDSVSLNITLTRAKRTERLSVSASSQELRSAKSIRATANLVIEPRAKADARESLSLNVDCRESTATP